MPESFVTNLPKQSYTVTEKMDGSCIVFFWHKNKWDVATLGSFYSTQAEKAREYCNKFNQELLKETKHLTLLFEIIYPENKIVVDYKGKEGLVLLSAYDTESGIELTRGEMLRLSDNLGMELVNQYSYSIDEMLELQKTMHKDKEGFVIRYQNGLRVKIKGEEYLRIHRAIANATPLNVWRNMKNGKLDLVFKKELPDEILPDIEKFQKILEDKYETYYTEIVKVCQEVLDTVSKFSDETTFKKNLGIFIKNNEFKYSHCVFPFYLSRNEVIEKHIMNAIEPKGNII